MSNPNREFLSELYCEYLEEASCLYSQISSLVTDPQISWLAIEDFEARMEAHLYGLIVGDALALEICEQQNKAGEAGESFAATRVFCRQDKYDLVRESLAALDPEDKERVAAIADALKLELPPAWQEKFTKLLPANPQLAPIVARVIGFQRLDRCSNLLLEQLHKPETTPTPEVIWALGRIRERQAQNDLLEFLTNSDPAMRASAELALLRFGDPQPIRLWKKRAEQDYCRFISVGLGGDKSYIDPLLKLTTSGNADPDCILAIGLLGSAAAVGALIAQLKNPDLASSAATALNLVTGADLYEEAFIPEEIDPDILLEEELEKLKKGESIYPPGVTPGLNVTRLSQDPNAWSHWIKQNKKLFQEGVRYRNGKPYSPECLLNNLQSARTPGRIRLLASEELTIRYGCNVPFEIDQPVQRQKRALVKIAEWVHSTKDKIQEGKWYFAGRPL
jgi:uncharacterized protein (TIGR02270 family)